MSMWTVENKCHLLQSTDNSKKNHINTDNKYQQHRLEEIHATVIVGIAIFAVAVAVAVGVVSCLAAVAVAAVVVAFVLVLLVLFLSSLLKG